MSICPSSVLEGSILEDDLRSLIYCDFADPKSADKNYVEVRDLEKLRHVAEGYLEEYNNMSKKPMNLVLFRSVPVSYGQLWSVSRAR